MKIDIFKNHIQVPFTNQGAVRNGFNRRNRMKILIPVLSIILSVQTFALQTPTTDQTPPLAPKYLTKSQLIPCVVELRNEAIGKVGSAILIGHKNRWFIVTATHVVNLLDSNSIITLRGDNDTPYKAKNFSTKIGI